MSDQRREAKKREDIHDHQLCHYRYQWDWSSKLLGLLRIGAEELETPDEMIANVKDEAKEQISERCGPEL